VTPGTGDLVFSSPVLPEAVVHLPSGNTISITAPSASETSFFVQSQRVNGTPSTWLYLPASMLTTGATIDYTMGSTPSTWGTGPNDAPPSYDSGGVVVPPNDNLALNRPATGSTPCNANEGPEKAVNGSVAGGNSDKWCSLRYGPHLRAGGLCLSPESTTPLSGVAVARHPGWVVGIDQAR
jgi:Glycosyl hydrolase family 92